jgi:hypothetical protein
MRLFFQFVCFLSLSVSTAFAKEASVEAYREKVRDWVRSHAKHDLLVPATAPEGNDRASDLVDVLKFSRLSDMEDANLLAGSLSSSPWSDSYWPTYAGQIANRYGDPGYYGGPTWKLNVEYLEKMMGRGADEHLSPAEKYDLLIGDTAFTLTKRMIRNGAPYADREGSVPTWFGLCHGWAAASFMMPRPKRGVTVQAVDGRKLSFTPSDLKALGTLLWANGAGETRFIGGRCNEKEPKRDGESRETNPDCFDTNPATWHMAVVNQIAVSKRSFVMDASAGSEVWNQPVLGYKYEYVNPITQANGRRLADHKVKLRDWKNDPFAAKRSPEAEYIVKIVMSLEYLAETSPSVAMEDQPENDSRTVQTYFYDLELDRDGDIVGGEWNTTVHPDFLWVPVLGSQASSRGDSWLDWQSDSARWDGTSPIPASWQKAAKLSSVSEQPLARVVSRLYEMASQ